MNVGEKLADGAPALRLIFDTGPDGIIKPRSFDHMVIAQKAIRIVPIRRLITGGKTTINFTHEPATIQK